MAEPRGQGPVKWFSLPVLWTSGREAATATQFARFADKREQQATAATQFYDLSAAGEGGFAFDFVADTGDGYDATYAVARAINGGMTGIPDLADRANLLVFGGDEVYPVASNVNYRKRLALPYRDLVTEKPGGLSRTEGWVAALPGNHDWYDGLVSFRRNFTESGLEFVKDGVETPQGLFRPDRNRGDEYVDRRVFQNRSYFAVRLPHGWWLWGLDSQLDAYVDEPQLAYFLEARRLIEDHERVILCTARPSWTDDPQLDQGDFESNRETLVWFVNRVFATEEQVSETLDAHTEKREGSRPEVRGQTGMSQVPLLISGDKHHYTRYLLQPGEVVGATSNVPRHLVTCGGGGAFLSSTHHCEDSLSVPWSFDTHGQSAYRYKKFYPDRDASKALGRRFLRIAYKNGVAFPVLLAAVDLTLFLTVRSAVDTGVGRNAASLRALVCLAVVAGLLGAFSALFSPGHRRRLLGLFLGFLHAAMHAVMVVGVLAATRDIDSAYATAIGLVLVAVLAPVVFALFLRWCDADLISWHENEFFSGMCFETHKCFLRIKVGGAGEGEAGILTVTAYGIEAPPPNRRSSGSPTGPTVHVIEEFTVAPDLSAEVVGQSTESQGS